MLKFQYELVSVYYYFWKQYFFSRRSEVAKNNMWMVITFNCKKVAIASNKILQIFKMLLKLVFPGQYTKKILHDLNAVSLAMDVTTEGLAPRRPALEQKQVDLVKPLVEEGLLYGMNSLWNSSETGEWKSLQASLSAW